MGFTPQRKQYRLKFQDEDLEGFEVLMKSANIGVLMSLGNLSSDGGAESIQGIEMSMNVLSNSLISWNMEDEDGNPVPADIEGLRQQDMSLIMSIITAWTEAISGVAPPLPGGSNSGETYPEVSLPMEALSPNQGN